MMDKDICCLIWMEHWQIQRLVLPDLYFALDKAGIHVENPDDLCTFIGPPLKDMFMEQFLWRGAYQVQASADYRVYFRKQGMLENVAYPGIIELLEQYRSRAKRWSLPVSRKVRLYHPEAFKLDSYMPDVAVPRWMVPAAIRRMSYYAVQKHRLRLNGVMIGDRRHDIIGGKKNMRTIGVL